MRVPLPALRPLPNESPDDFAVRWHEAIQETIRKADEAYAAQTTAKES